MCLLWQRCSHCCPQRNYLSPPDVSGPSRPEECVPLCPVLCHSFMERVFCLSSVQTCAVLAALNYSINYSTLLVPECFALRMDRFLPQRVGRFKVTPPRLTVSVFILLRLPSSFTAVMTSRVTRGHCLTRTANRIIISYFNSQLICHCADEDGLTALRLCLKIFLN